MAHVIGYVSKVSGDAKLTKINGEVVELGMFSQIHKNDLIESDPNANIEVVMTNGNVVNIQGQKSVLVDETVYESRQFDQDEVRKNENDKDAVEKGDIFDLDDTEAGEQQLGTSQNIGDAFTQRGTDQGFAAAEVAALSSGLNALEEVEEETEEDDIIQGINLDGDNVLYGTSGNDIIDGGNGNDTIYGGAGDDTLYGGNGNDTIYGGAGDDVIYGGPGDDVIYGGDGDDTIYGGGGNDTIIGGDGNDTIFGGDGDDYIEGGDGDDVIDGGNGNDTIYGGNGNDTINGGAGDDTIYGGAGDDVIDGGDGNDTIYGEDGNDTINGGAGDDFIDGGAGDDVIDGGDGNDTIYGGDGNDTINGGAGDDLIYGGEGNDTINGGDGNDTIYGDGGDDLIYGGEGNDTIYGGDGNDTIFGEGGDDLIYGGAGDDVIDGGDGNDTIYGEEGNDTINGGAGNDYIEGGAGNDVIDGGEGNDTIYGGEGNDTINGGAGDDFIDGGTGDDLIDGGDGDDTIYGGDGNDTINGGAGDDLIYGGNDNDVIDGGDDNDVIYGGEGDDTIHGGNGDDTIYGEGGNDTLYGDADNDTLYGGDGDDLLYGGSGINVIDGGDGNDTAVFEGNQSDYDFIYNDDGSITVKAKDGSSEDTITDVETFRFADGDVVLADLVGVTVAIDVIGGDNKINDTEAGQELSITGTTTAANGAVVSLYVGNSDVPFATAEASDGKFAFTVAPGTMKNFPDGTYDVRVDVVKDLNGNTASAQTSVTLDRFVGEVTIDSITPDSGTLDTDFITNEGTVTISGTFVGDGDNVLTVTIDDEPVNVSTDGNAWTATVTPGEGSHDIQASVTDAAGNTTSVGRAMEVDTSVGDHYVTLDTISDGFLNAQESGETLTISGESNVEGAVVSISVIVGDNSYPLSDAVVENGVFSVDISTAQIAGFDDGEYTVKAEVISDIAGNVVSDSQVVVKDTEPLNVTINPIDDDFTTTSSSFNLTGTADLGAGDSIVVKIGDTIYTPSVDGSNWSVSVTDLPESTYTVKVIASDAAGNETVVNQEVIVTSGVDNSLLNLNEISGNFINAVETGESLVISGTSVGANGTEVSFELNGNPLVIDGNDVTATVQNGEFEVVLDGIDWSGFPDGEYTVTAKANVNGSNVTDTENVILDTDPGNGTIELNDIGDNIINATEDDGNVQVSGKTTGIDQGQEVTVTFNGVDYTTSTKADGSFVVFVPVGNVTDGQTFDVSATVVSDAAGNTISTQSPVTVTIDLSAGTLQAATASVDEAGLDAGTNPSPSDRTASGNLFDGATGTEGSSITSVSMDGVAATVWSENSDILVVQSDSGTLYVATSATTQDGVDYAEGDYLYVLENAGSDSLESVAFTITDVAGNTASSTLEISINDDVATGNTVDKYINADADHTNTTNLLLTVDISGSMNWTPNGQTIIQQNNGSSSAEYRLYNDGNFYQGYVSNGYFYRAQVVGDMPYKIAANVMDAGGFTFADSRMDLAKEALINLIEAYADKSNVNIQLVTFNGDAYTSFVGGSGYGNDANTQMRFMNDPQAAIDFINNDLYAPSMGSTDYLDAMTKVQSFDSNQFPESDDNFFYFISDGEANEGNFADPTAWNAYADANFDDVFAIGVGTNSTQLQNIGGDNTIIIDDATGLDAALLSTVAAVTGQLTTFDVDGTVVELGADGGQITSVEIDGQTYTYEQYNNKPITTADGTFTINYDDGSYSFRGDVNEGQVVEMTVTAQTNDAQEVTGTLNLHLYESVDQNLALDAAGVDGGAGYDTLVLQGTESIDFANVQNIQHVESIDLTHGEHQLLNISAQDVLDMTDGNVDHTLTILGDGNDEVNLEANNGWQQDSQSTEGGHTYNVYTNTEDDTITLKIEAEINVTVS